MSNSQNDATTIDETAWVHDSALIYGHVSIGPDSSVWPYAVMRSEMYHIVIGARTNIQDFVMVHVGAGTPTIIGDAHVAVRVRRSSAGPTYVAADAAQSVEGDRVDA